MYKRQRVSSNKSIGGVNSIKGIVLLGSAGILLTPYNLRFIYEAFIERKAKELFGRGMACIKEIALRNSFITKDELKNFIINSKLYNSYGNYLADLVGI